MIHPNLGRLWFPTCIVVIVFFSAILRFYNYENRWGLAYDQAHDALVARYALEAKKLPLLGPFSSAGPFQTGGEWYWFIMAATLLYPVSVLTPWIAMTLLHISFVIIIILLGKELLGKMFGLLVGVLSSISTAQIAQSVSLTNQSPVSFLSLLSIYCAILYIKNKKDKFLFLLGFFVSLASVIHLQGVSLFFLLPITILLTGFPRPKRVFILLLGVVLPLMPIVIYDSQHNFFNFRNMLQYYLHDQYKISFEALGKRWLTYISVFWPNAWAHVIGGTSLFGSLIILLCATIFSWKIVKFKIKKEWILIFACTSFSIVLLRYIRTPLYDSYVVFLHPFILLLSAFSLFTLLKRSLILGIIAIFLVISASMLKNISELSFSSSKTANDVITWTRELAKKFPEENFSIYDRRFEDRSKTLSLILFLNAEKKLKDDGYKLGIGMATKSGQMKYPSIVGRTGEYQILDLNGSSSAILSSSGWSLVSPKIVYKSTEEWDEK